MTVAHRRPSSSHGLRCRDELRAWLREHDRAYTHFITLATNEPMMTVPRARERLSEWDKRMSKLLVGGRWQERPAQRPIWIAFLENKGNGPHWHLLLRLSSQMRAKRLELLSNTQFDIGQEAETAWKHLVQVGSTDTQQITCIGNLIDYVTKQTHDARFISEFVIESELR